MGKQQSKVIPLEYPIPIPKEGGGTVNVSELTLSRLKAKHFKLLPDDFAEGGGKIAPKDMIPLIAGLADIPESSADEIDVKDLIAIGEGLEDFLSEFLQIGETPSGG